MYRDAYGNLITHDAATGAKETLLPNTTFVRRESEYLNDFWIRSLISLTFFSRRVFVVFQVQYDTGTYFVSSSLEFVMLGYNVSQVRPRLRAVSRLH